MTVELIASSLVYRENPNKKDVVIDFYCNDCGQVFHAVGHYKSQTVIEIPRVTREDLICCPKCLEIQKEAGRACQDTTPTG